MLIKIDSLKICNFGIYRGVTNLNFKGRDIIGILAEYADAPTRSNRSGKCFGKDTPIRMFDGSIKKVQNVNNGDFVMGPDSKKRVVHGTTSGKEEMYLVESHDKTISFKCNISHILSLKASCSIIICGKSYSKTDIINISIKDYLSLSNYKKSMLHLYRSCAIQYKESELPIPAYLYGLFLGDGSQHNGNITNGDAEIKKYIENYCEKTKGVTLKTKRRLGKTCVYYDFKLTGETKGRSESGGSTSPYQAFLKSEKQIDRIKGKKYRSILRSFMISSEKQRLELLAGIIDTDGHFANSNYYEISTKSDVFADNVTELCRSLGLATSRRVKEGSINGVVVGNYHRINIYGDIHKIPCKVERKRTNFRTTKRDVLRKGFSVRKISEQEDYYGFAVDKDNLFLLADYTVVHNSLLTEAIMYNLVGTTRAKKEVDMIHRGMDSMYVEAIYSDADGKTYTIKRGREIKGAGLLELDWIEKTKESQQAITNIFGVSSSDFELTNFFKQADVNGFMDLSPSEKTKHLMKWVDNSYWEDINKEVRDDIRDYKVKLKENEAIRKSLEDSSVLPQELKVEIATLKKEKKSLEGDIISCENDISEIEKDILSESKKLSVNEEKIKALKRKIREAKSVDDDILELKKDERILSDDIKELKKRILGIKEYQDSTEELHTEISTKKADLASLQTEDKLLKKAQGICPILKVSCSKIEFDKKGKNELSSEINTLLDDIDTASEILMATINRNKMIDKCSKIENELAVVTRDINKMEKSSVDYLELQDELQALEAKTNTIALDRFEDDKRDIKIELSELRVSFNSANRKLSSLEAQLENAEKDIDRMAHLEIKNSKLREIIEQLNYIAMMTGKNGIPSDEIENAFGEVQDDINYLMGEIGSGVSISFSPDKELGKWEDFCSCGYKFPKGFRGNCCADCGESRNKKRKDEISLKVIENGVESDFNLDSGGGKCFGPDVEILMFDGSRKIAKDIIIGDLIMGPDSQPRRVERLTSGIAPMYRVTPTKGKSFTCNGKHVLPLKTTARSYKHLEGNIQVEDYMKQTNGFKRAMKMWRTGVDFSSKDAMIDPYLVGLWLGDGFSHQNGNRKDAQGLVDLKTVREMCLVKNGISQEKRKYINKHFLTASRKSRLELLAGLLDSDGHLHHGFFEILVKSNQLADGVVFLAQSLGFQVTTRIKKTNSPTDRTHYFYYHRINISGNVSEIPTKVKKKIASERKQVKNPLRVGFAVEQIDTGEYYGFEVSGNDHLIMLGDFTVSHNCIISFCVRIALTMLKRRQNKSKLNILFLDEVDSALDPYYCESVVSTITRILTKVLGYDQIFMISHKEEIKNAIPNIIKVVRYSDYSKASFV